MSCIKMTVETGGKVLASWGQVWKGAGASLGKMFIKVNFILFKIFKLYLFTFTISKLQIQTTCKIVELIEAGSIETCLFIPNIQYYSHDIKIYNNYKITEINITIQNTPNCKNVVIEK